MGPATWRRGGLHRGDPARGGRLMSDTENTELEKRLAALEKGSARAPTAAQRRSPLLALIVVLVIGAGGALLYLLSQPDEEEALPTATPDVFQNEGDGFGAIETLPPPEPEVVFVGPDPAEPNAELLAQITALQAQIEELRNAPEPVVEEDTAAEEAIDALATQIAALQAASEAAQQRFQDELTARDRSLEQLRMDLELAQLEASRPQPAPAGPTEDELRAREEEARRMAELERRAAEERAFQERRITSPTIAFGGASGANETALTERTFGEVTDFVLNGALPSTVTQAEVIANPSNTIVQGTMIQAVMETALDSSLPGQTRAVISEDVYSVDGVRL